MKREFSVFVLCACILSMCTLVVSCGDSEPSTRSNQDVANRDSILSYLDTNDLSDVTTEHESGIFYQVLNQTTGRAVSSGNVVSIYYDASALHFQSFDRVSVAEGDEPAKLQHGSNSVYPIGLDIGLGLMKEGETYLFYIPSSLAYGDLDNLSSIIPPYSVIKIEVTLATVQSESDIYNEETFAMNQKIATLKLDSLPLFPLDSFLITNAGLYYKRVKEGEPEGEQSELLMTGDITDIRYRAYKLSDYPGSSPFETATFSYNYNTNSVFAGLDQAVSLMEKRESATFFIPSRLAYGASAFVIPNNRKQFLVDENVIPQYAAKVLPFEVLVFEIDLLDNAITN